MNELRRLIGTPYRLIIQDPPRVESSQAWAVQVKEIRISTEVWIVASWLYTAKDVLQAIEEDKGLQKREVGEDEDEEKEESERFKFFLDYLQRL